MNKLEKITTDKGNEYIWLYESATVQVVIPREKWRFNMHDKRDERQFKCTPQELRPLMNKLGF